MRGGIGAIGIQTGRKDLIRISRKQAIAIQRNRTREVHFIRTDLTAIANRHRTAVAQLCRRDQTAVRHGEVATNRHGFSIQPSVIASNRQRRIRFNIHIFKCVIGFNKRIGLILNHEIRDLELVTHTVLVYELAALKVIGATSKGKFVRAIGHELTTVHPVGCLSA